VQLVVEAVSVVPAVSLSLLFLSLSLSLSLLFQLLKRQKTRDPILAGGGGGRGGGRRRRSCRRYNSNRFLLRDGDHRGYGLCKFIIRIFGFKSGGSWIGIDVVGDDIGIAVVGKIAMP